MPYNQQAGNYPKTSCVLTNYLLSFASLKILYLKIFILTSIAGGCLYQRKSGMITHAASRKHYYTVLLNCPFGAVFSIITD